MSLSSRRRRARLFVAATVTAAMVASVLVRVPSASAAPGSAGPQADPVLPVGHVKADVPPFPKMTSLTTKPVVWPNAAASVVPVASSAGAVSVGGLSVKAGPSASPDATSQASPREPSQLNIEVVDRQAAQRVGVALALRVSSADRQASTGRVRLQVGYDSFRDAYGAGWDSRLTLVALPGCALRTSPVVSCLQPTLLPTDNNVKAGTLTADIDLAQGVTTLPISEKQAALEGVSPYETVSEPLVVGIMAAGSSDIGDYTKTDFHPNYSWSAGGNSGDFTLSYPLQVPPVPGPLTPQVALNYSSGAVDGQTVGVNVQPFWGEGWNYSPGYVERAYRQCKDEVANSPIYTITTTDNCWRLPNARMVLGGKSVELILGNDGVWRTENDDAAKVELLTGGTGTGLYNNERWKVSTVDGTVYYFGLTRLPGWTTGDRETNAALGMPVYSNHNGDPCIDAQGVGWTTSWCQMAYRWNLDYVVDRNGNTMSFWYTKEGNKTALAGNASYVTTYDRFGVLNRIEYGTRGGTGTTRESRPGATPPAQVVFSYADRCITTSCTTHDLANWPDTPWDLECTGTSCANNMTPSFWSTRRASQIATEVYSGTGTTYHRVDEWALGAEFPIDASGSPLWLSSITRTGKVGGSAGLPSLQFYGTRLRNRADWDPNGTMADPQKYRITSVRNEYGGQADVTYEAQDAGCQFGSPFPDPDNNDKRCFARRWVNPTGDLGWAWWHKYVVKTVVEKDLVGGTPDKTTSYSYDLAGAGSTTGPIVLWAYDKGASVFATSTGFRSWADWRGYPTVTTTVGALVGQQSQTRTLYFRGLNEDHTDNGYYARNATVTNSLGEVTNDEPSFEGMIYESQTLNGPAGQVISKTITDAARYLTGTRDMTNSWAIPPTQWSYIGRATRQRNMVWVASTSTWLTSEKNTVWNTTYGVVDRVDNLGGSGASDDVCTRYSYTFPATGAPYLIDFPNRIEAVGVNCAATPIFPQHGLSDVRSFYDNAASYGTAPTLGNVTKVEAAEKYVGTTPTVIKRNTKTYDQWGRPTSDKDGRDKGVTVVYTQNTAGLTTTVKQTNALAHDTTISLDPSRGVPLTVTDPNGKVTTGGYDPLGRLTTVWRPGHPTSGTADVDYEYGVTQTAPPYIRTRDLGPNGNLIYKYEIYDGLLNLRQVQDTAPSGKRRVTETRYDTRGLTLKSSIYYDSANAPLSTLASLADSLIDEQARYVYDGAGRKTAAQRWSREVFWWQSTYTYGGDRVAIVQPTGGVNEQEIYDARGNVLKRRQFLTSDINGAYEETSYTYDSKGQPTSVTDPGGKQWTLTYDMLGRKTTSTDPDAGAPGASFGTSAFTYDAGDRQLTSTDPNNVTLAYDYDDLNRKTGVFEGSLAGTQRASWVFDTVAKGQLSSSSRIDGGVTYTSAVTAFDDGYRPLSTTYTIPGFGPGGTTLTYTIDATYKTNGKLATQTMPAVAGLTGETITHAYSDPGMATTMSSGLASYISATSYAFDGLATQLLHGASGSRFKLDFSYSAGSRRLLNTSVATETATVGTYQTQYSTDYGYDKAGNITSAAGKTYDGTTLASDQAECFRYDHLARLVEAWTQVSGTCTTPQRTGADPYWRQWTFENGSRKTQKDIDSGAGNTDWTYTMGGTACGGTAKPHQVTSITATGPKAGTATRSFCYDTAGNTTSRTTETGATQTLTWDKENHLKTLTQAGTTHTYLYDADGNRLIAKDSSSGDTLYLPDGTEIKKLVGGQLDATRYYSRGGTAPFAVRQGTTLTWIASDRHGSGYVQASAATLATSRRRLMPFGEPRGTQPTWVGTKGFVNGTTDPTGLTHVGAREYDPTMGRFISSDPILVLDDPRALHPYTYANHTPVTLNDATGLRYARDDGAVLPIAVVAGGLAGAGAVWAAAAFVTVVGMIAVIAAVAIWAANQKKNAQQAADAAGIHGTQEGAEQLQGIAKDLQDTRVKTNENGDEDDYAKRRGTTSVIKVWDAVTGEYIIKVAVEDARIQSMPEGWEEIIRKTVGNEIKIEFVRNLDRLPNGVSAHAELSILAKLGTSEVVVEGGTSRNVCIAQCEAALRGRDLEIGGETHPGHDDKTPYRTFWRPMNSNSYPVGTGGFGMTP